MPDRPMRPCCQPGCGALVISGYCSKHAKERDQQRGNFRARGYTAGRWESVRAHILRRDPVCVICKQQNRVTVSTVCDHIVPHKGNYGLMWDQNNMQGICATCHNRKTATEDGGFGRERKVSA